MASQRAPAATSTFLAGLPRLLVVAVGLPIMIVLADQLAIEASKSIAAARIVLPVLFVAQVGVLSACAGRFIDNVFLRCVVFVWAIALVDALALLTMFFGLGTVSQCMMFALLSGQIGLLTIWGMMSGMTWPVRMPIFFVLISSFVIIMLRAPGMTPWRNESEIWAIILALQGAVVVGLCSILRFRGYRILPPIGDDHGAGAADREQFQFSIKHIILWMTATGPILVLAKGIDWLLLESLELFWAVLLALAMALVSWVTMFSALGSGHYRLRILMLSSVPPMIGLLLTWVTSHWTMSGTSSNSSRLFIELRQFGFGWVLWSALAAWFLAALLLVFRAAGYRIMRARRTVDV
ncbi:MAG TPA: hypothetical protein QF564_04270 [Pirellulaceae bacterium]|jgi:hypothetical protein|nr:hypothetical protein [Pirellulaceae bacterium]